MAIVRLILCAAIKCLRLILAHSCDQHFLYLSKMKNFFLLSIFVILTACGQDTRNIGSIGPNVILISSDSQSALDYGFMMSDTIKSPGLDQLAAGGILFSQGYLPSQDATKNTTATYTGRTPSQHKSLVDSLTAGNLPLANIENLAQLLQSKGYETVYDGPGELDGLDGFNSKNGFSKFISSVGDKSFFVHVNTSAREVDNKVSMILNVLKQKKILSNTIIVYYQNEGIKNRHDLSYRTPIIFHSPGRIPPNSRSISLISTLDIMPTLFDFLNIDCPANISGLSYKDVISGKSKKMRKTIYGKNNDILYLRTTDYYFSWNTLNDVKTLFELINDPTCTDNMVSYHPNKTSRYLRELKAQ